MYTRSDISMDQRLEIFSQFWRFGDRHGFVSELAAQQQVSRHFIYDLASRVRQALDWRAPRKNCWTRATSSRFTSCSASARAGSSGAPT